MSAEGDSPLPMTPAEVADRYFLEHRAKVLDIAAFLDRFDRAAKAAGQPPSASTSDVRVRALLRAIEVLRDASPDRARRILELWSDHSTEPIDTAGMKGAVGAVKLD